MSERDQEALGRIADATELLVKLIIREVQGERTQTEMVVMLGSMGCESGQIADFLGVSPKTVYPILSRARKAKKN